MYRILQEKFVDKGYTVLIIAHRLKAVLQHMRPQQDIAVILDDGRVKAIGSIQDVLGLSTLENTR